MTSLIWLILLYAVLVLAGGFMGYIKAQSKASLISGVGSGVALAIAWYIALQNLTFGLFLAALIALALLITFIVRFRKTGKFMPAGLMAILSLLASIAFSAGWFLARGGANA